MSDTGISKHFRYLYITFFESSNDLGGWSSYPQSLDRRLQERKVKEAFQNHTARKWQGQDANRHPLNIILSSVHSLAYHPMDVYGQHLHSRLEGPWGRHSHGAHFTSLRTGRLERALEINCSPPDTEAQRWVWVTSRGPTAQEGRLVCKVSSLCSFHCMRLRFPLSGINGFPWMFVVLAVFLIMRCLFLLESKEEMGNNNISSGRFTQRKCMS